jgi:ABC-2 type transport system permease protein
MTQSLVRIGAMVLRYWYLLRSSWSRVIELIYWPAVQMLMWGFLQLYIDQNASFFARAGGAFIGAVMLWDILFRGQLGFSISFLEEMWFFMLLLMTSWSVGILVSGLVVRNGLGAETFAWSIMFLLLPLTCVYYPVTVLPGWLQTVAWALPPTYVFEGMRALLLQKVFRADLMLWALALNVVYFTAASFAFLALLNSARRQGSLLQTGE